MKLSGFYSHKTDNSISCLGCYNRDAPCLLYTSDAADERSSVDLGGRRIIKKKQKIQKKKKNTHTTYTSTIIYITHTQHEASQPDNSKQAE